MQGLFHCRTAQAEPLLKEVDAKHGLHCKRRTPGLALGRERRNQRHQRIPQHDTIHLVEELALAAALGSQVQPQVDLLHGRIVSASRANVKNG